MVTVAGRAAGLGEMPSICGCEVK
jgi:hypothetical protein